MALAELAMALNMGFFALLIAMIAFYMAVYYCMKH